MSSPPPAAALLRSIVNWLLVALLGLGSIGAVPAAAASGDLCADGCPCESAVEAPHAHDDSTDGAPTLVLDDCAADREHCPPDCDNCHCSVSATHALLGARLMFYPLLAALELREEPMAPGHVANSEQRRLDRPPRRAAG